MRKILINNDRLISTIVFPFELAGLNEFINEQRKNIYLGNRLKRDETTKCRLTVRSYINRGLSISPDDYPIDIKFHWICSNRRKDKDNICFAKKFILDGMVEAGLIPNDGWRKLGEFSDSFSVDAENPRIEVALLRAG